MSNKKKYANIFPKIYIIIFSLLWFGFLVYGAYFNIKKGAYSMLLFSIPFWIAGIHIVRKFLFEKKRLLKINFPVLIPTFLVGLVLIVGVVCFVVGVKDTWRISKITRDYLTTTGYLMDYDIYSSDKDGTTYKLIYMYQVGNQTYTVSTDYGVGHIPERGSAREVKYNPEHCEEAILAGTNSKNGMLFFGLFFILGATVFIVAALQIHGTFDKVKIDVIGTYVGAVFLIIGIGFLLFQKGTTASFREMIQSLGVLILIPIMFILAGGFQIVKCLFFYREK